VSTTVELPDFWVMFDPDGYADGSLHATFNGEIRRATAEDAWKDFTPNARSRAREKREGWRVVGVEQADWSDYWSRKRKLEPEAVSS
jgi:hypothetical protein